MNNALILIDFINEIVHEDGKIADKGYAEYIMSHEVLDRLNKLMLKARGANVPIIHVRLGFSKDYSELPHKSLLLGSAKNNGAFLLESWATEFHEDLDVQEHDYIITKHSMSPFYNTELDKILVDLGVKKVFIAGVATDLAVQSAAREAHDRNYEVVVIEDCCAAESDIDHDNSVETIKKFCVIDDEENISFNKNI